jgi:hypothetical protein
MAGDKISDSWKDELTRGLPLWMKITVWFSGILLTFFVVLGGSFLIIGRNMDVEFGLKGFKATRPETTLEKNCRSESEAFAAFDQGLISNIGALNDRMSILVRDMDEIRKKCLAEVQAKTGPFMEPAGVAARRDHLECHTPDGSFLNFNPNGRYGLVLGELSGQQQDIRSQIAGLQEQRRQAHQHLIEMCSSH